MINELYQLSVAMSDADIAAESWHREYKEIPNVRPNAPCVRIILSGGRIVRLETVPAEMAAKLRKFGSNQGSFPAMNLAPLYRVSEEEAGKQISNAIRNRGEGLHPGKVRDWCICNNWGSKFAKKYRISMESTPHRLSEMLSQTEESENILRLIEEARYFSKPEALHTELSRVAFEMLETRYEVGLALQVLFYIGKKGQAPHDDYGSLSVILDSEYLEDIGMPSAGIRFTRGFNRLLLLADEEEKSASEETEHDAFGMPFSPSDEPMPAVKLAGGFEVSLRTMFKGQPCQHRYHRIENETYPISRGKRSQLANALTWISQLELRDKTWINTDKNEILFVYPSRLPEAAPEFVHQFGRRKHQDRKKQELFEAESAAFREYISRTRESDPEHYPEQIQIFILRKLDKARTTVVYTRNTTPDEIIRQSDGWRKAADNLPPLPVGRPWTPFPLEIAQIMNRIWKQDGKLAADRFKPIASYHGMELLFGVPPTVWDRDIHLLVENTGNLAVYAGNHMNSVKRHIADEKQFPEFKGQTGFALVLLGMLLSWRGIRKEDYMNDFPYLLGQMLKASDSLHELYCWNVRDGEIPPQLVGNGMYVFASESPYSAMAQLGMRMIPYLAWARKNREERIVTSRRGKDGETTEVNGPSAGYLLSVYEKAANLLHNHELTEQNRFNDYEKAQLFIGYLASFPKSEPKVRLAQADGNHLGGIENGN